MAELLTVNFPGSCDCFTISQKRDTLSHGTTIWSSSVVLASLVLSNVITVSGRQVLEFGAGCGLSGLTAGLHGASKVHFTDLDNVVKYVLEDNIDRNRSAIAKNNATCSLSFSNLDWTQALKNNDIHKLLSENPWDIILAGDCLFALELIPHFIQCLVFASKMRENQCRIVVASERRDDFVRNAFLQQAKKVGFTITSVSKRKTMQHASRIEFHPAIDMAMDQVEVWILRRLGKTD